MKKLCLLLAVVFSTLFVLQAQVATGKLSFASTVNQLSGSVWTLQDTVTISADSSEFKSLLVVTGKMLYDTTNPTLFRLVGPNQLFAKVGDGALQLLWAKTNTDTTTVLIDRLVGDSGLTIPNGSNIFVNNGNISIQVNRVYLQLPSDTTGSYVAVNGRLFLPETGGCIFHDFEGPERVLLLDTVNAAPSFSQSIDTSFSIRNAGYRSQNLIFNYNETTQLYTLYGTLVYRIDNNDIPVVLGDSLAPGIVYTNGVLSSINLIANDTFRLFNQKFYPHEFSVCLNNSDSTYKLYGGLAVETEQSKIRLQLGDSLHPGCMGKAGKLLQFRASVPDTFNIRQLSFRPGAVQFVYDTSSSGRFYMFGDLTCLLKNDSTGIPDSIAVHFGTEADPGFEIFNGELQELAMGITADFILKGIRLSADTVGFVYNKTAQTYSLYGKIGVSVDSTTYHIDAGDLSNPGIVMVNGKLTQLRVSIDDTLTVRNFKIKPQQLTFKYDSSSHNSFSIFGDALLVLNADSTVDSLSVSLGSEAEPGMLLSDGILQELHLGISGDFTLKGLSISPDSLNAFYTKASNTFGLYGHARLAIENDTLDVDAGDEQDPGILLTDGKLQSIHIALTDTVKIKTLTLVPKGLTFIYNRDSALYAMYGNITAMVENDSVYAELGTAAAPGFEYKEGKINKLNMAVNGEFGLKGIQFKSEPTDPLTFSYDGDQQQYELFGTTLIHFDSNQMKIGLGNETTPGIVYANGVLQQIDISITDTFRLRGLLFEPQNLTFEYDHTSALYRLFGAANVVVKTDTISLNIGTDSLPGMSIQNGQLQDINIGIEADFKLKSVEFHPKNLSFFYTKNNKQFGIYGALDIRFDSNTIDMDMGTLSHPGLAFNTSGELEAVNLITTDTLLLYGLIVRPQALSFTYNRNANQYEMAGSVMAALKSDSVLLTLGDATTPGFVFRNGQLLKLDLTVSDSLHLYGLSMKAKDLTCSYVKANKQYKIYGDLSLHFSNETIDANLGTETQPGLLIEHSQVQSINFGLTSNFKIGVVEFETNGLTLQYDRDSNYYEMFGSVGFTLEDETVSASLGDEHIPGFTIRNGVLYEMNISISSNLNIGSLKVNAHDVGMYYTRTNDGSKYIIRGTVSVNELWSVTTTLGVNGDPNSGLEIIEDNGKVKVDVTNFIIEAQHVSIAGVTFNDLYVSYTKVSGGFDIDAKVDVSFPPGFEVGGEIDFAVVNNKFTLNKINLMYDAGTTEGIEVGETGVFITHLGGGVSLLAGSTSDYAFNGSIVVNAGGKFTLDNKSFAMLRIEGDVVIDKNHLNITDIIDVAAIEDNGTWEGLYGSGIVSLDLNWNTGVYQIDGDLKYYSMVEFKTEAYYHSNHTMGALGEVNLIVPDFIPVIGGKTITGIDGAVRYNKNDLNNSIAAGWVNVNLAVKTVTAGAEYNFGKNSVKSIGQKDVKNLEKQVSNDGQTESRHYTFNVPDYVHTVTVNIKPVSPQAYMVLMTMLRAQSLGIDIGCDLELFTPVPGIFGRFNISAMLAQSFFQGGTGVYNSNYYSINVDSLTVNGLALHFQGTAIDKGELLPTGQYTLLTSFSDQSAPLFTVEFQNHFLSPEGHARGTYNRDTRKIDMDFDALLFVNDTATATIYQSETPDYKGAVIGTVQLGAPGSQGRIPYELKYSYDPPRDSVVITYDSLRTPIDKLPTLTEKNFYLYAVINDGANAPVYTPISGPTTVRPDFYMSITPKDVRTVQDGLRIKGLVDLGMNFEYPEAEKQHYRVSVYYDFDNNGTNGYPVTNMQNLTLDQIENSDTAFSFIINDLIKAGNNSTYYFYAVVAGTPIGKGYTSSYSAPVSFAAPLLVNVKYKTNDMFSTSNASGIKVWLDLNKNEIYDNGVDPVHLTDFNGQCGFFTTGAGTYMVGLLLDSATALNNPELDNQTLTIALNKSTSILFSITHKTTRIKGTYNFVDAHLDTVAPGLYTSFGSENNYFYVDLNNNLRWDTDEPRVINDLSQAFEFSITQPSVNIYFVDMVSRIHNQQRFKAYGRYTINGKAVNGGGDEFQTGTVFDTKLATDSVLNTAFNGLMNNLNKK